MATIPKPSYAVEQRLRFVDFLLFHYGYVRRSALMEYFGISVAQASADLKLYDQMTDGNLDYNKTSKRYELSNLALPYYR